MVKDVKHEWTKCSRCRQMGYYSVKFEAVLCDPHFFEMNADLRKQQAQEEASHGSLTV